MKREGPAAMIEVPRVVQGYLDHVVARSQRQVNHPATEIVAVTEIHTLPPVERPESEPTWMDDAPTAGFPYAEGWVPRPMPEA